MRLYFILKLMLTFDGHYCILLPSAFQEHELMLEGFLLLIQ